MAVLQYVIKRVVGGFCRVAAENRSVNKKYETRRSEADGGQNEAADPAGGQERRKTPMSGGGCQQQHAASNDEKRVNPEKRRS
ncbi:hypothetical protein OJAV_G00231420 [Oryzias javanicus]|uniref:Uncharacterized protein n=1 Tax=Oryzias javanicus TaxID=123683 RepID=A0A437BZP0_ORYJA|nr:hypothetical protein OJAV_G00231420 [Oryzias javanicus]